MQIRLSDHFTYSRLLRFTLPSVVTMIVASIYSVVDGLFVSNLVGAMALSAINIAFPVAMIIGAVGFMLGTGGSALVAKTLGEGKKELANQYFSMLIYSIIGIGAILTVIILIFVRPIMRLAGASDLLMESSVTYGTILISGSVPFMLQVSFQNFFVVNEKPVLGLVLSIASGVTNMVLDYVFIAVLKMGVAGAGLATVMGYVVGGAIPLLYFAKKREHGLQLTRTRFYGKQLLQAVAQRRPRVPARKARGQRVAAARAHDGVARVEQAGHDHAQRAQEPLDVGHGEGADVVPREVERVEDPLPPPSAQGEERAQPPHHQVAQQPQQRHIQERNVKVKGGEVRDDGRRRRDVEHDLHDELVVVRPEEVQLFQRVSQRDDEDVGRSLEQYLSHACSPSVLYFLQVTV